MVRNKLSTTILLNKKIMSRMKLSEVGARVQEAVVGNKYQNIVGMDLSLRFCSSGIRYYGWFYGQ